MLTDFYSGKTTDPNGRFFDDVMALDDDTIQTTRDYIPWIFPLAEESRAYRGAPILTKDELDKFRGDDTLKAQIKVAVNRFLRFLHGNIDWQRAVDPSHAKISQMIKFLTMVGMTEDAQKVAEWCSKNGGSLDAHKRWAKLLRYQAPWERPQPEKEDPPEDNA